MWFGVTPIGGTCILLNDNDRLSQPAGEPLVSVLMPVCNAEKWLGEAIESMLRQAYERLEILIIDNGSHDRSAAICASFGDPRIRCLEEPAGALVSVLNYGLAHAAGAVIARQDADDWSVPSRFEKQLAHLHAHPNVGIVGTGFVETTLDGQTRKYHHAQTTAADVRRHLLITMPFAGASVIGWKEIFDRLGGYDPTFDGVVGEDYDFLVRAADLTDLEGLDEPLYYYRTGNPRSMTAAINYEFEPMQRAIRARAAARGNRLFRDSANHPNDSGSP
jgi:glycosyltransferase involved in cell wall biosynthesis